MHKEVFDVLWSGYERAMRLERSCREHGDVDAAKSAMCLALDYKKAIEILSNVEAWARLTSAEMRGIHYVSYKLDDVKTRSDFHRLCKYKDKMKRKGEQQGNDNVDVVVDRGECNDEKQG